MNLISLIESAARTHADATAVSWIDRPLWSYEELFARASSLAAGLRAMGLAPGDRVMLAMSNVPAYIEVLLGAWIAGLVPAPQNSRLHAREIAQAAEDCGARACFSTQHLTEGLRERLPRECALFDVDSAKYAELHDHGTAAIEPRQSTDAAFLFYTSGTTGKPKGAVLTHRSLIAMVVSFLADSGAVVDDHLMHLAPLSHAGGFLALAYLVRARNNVILPSGAPDAECLRRALTAFAPLSFFAVPTVVRRLMHHDLLAPALIGKIHRIFFGGAPMYVEDLKRAIEAFGVERLWHLYGQGETPNTITHLPPRLFGTSDDAGYEDRLASVGIARSGVLVRIFREDGTQAGAGEVGEVVVQGDTLMAGYWNKPQESAAALRGGWLHTGDLGRMDERGYLTLVDRSRDVIISGGSNIYPREIEEVLLTHPQVAECAVVGRPHPEWGEVPYAFVVAAGTPPQIHALDELCLANLARYKRPKEYRFVSDLPKSAYGKILKAELRKQLAGSAAAD
jgi:long-chain acyl-CoA synthetase